jgi:glycosyltransferase involved in cell wall biosynthesis
MLHFQAQLANSMSANAPTIAVVSAAAIVPTLSRSVSIVTLDIGRTAFGALVQSLNPVCWYMMLRSLRSTRADIVHIVGVHEWNPIVSIVTKLLGKPLVYTVHDPEPHAGAPLGMRASNWITARLADAVVVLTQYGRDVLVSQGFHNDRVFHIPQGVFAYFAAWRRGRVKAEKVILHFGRIEPYKGIEVLLAAYARVRRRLPGWKLVVAGSGELPEPLGRTNHPGVEVLNRYVGDDEVAQLMQRAQLVVLPYLQATQSAVIGIAFSFSRAVIASDVGGLKEMVRHGRTGLLVPANDITALAGAIESLARNPGRRSRMGKAAFRLARKQWAWDDIARRHVRLYKRVLSRHGNR